MSRLTGHALWHEGAAHDDNGLVIWVSYIHSAGTGRGKCECGELSEVLPSGGWVMPRR